MTKVDDDILKAVVEDDTSQTTRELTAKFKVSILTTLEEANRQIKVLDQWVPNDLSKQQK